MRHKKILWSLLLSICFGLTGLQAQNMMFVNEKSGTQTAFAFATINKLTFPAGNITVNKNDGSTNAYALTNIRYLNFGVATSISAVSVEGNSKITIFPNPVLDQLQIQYISGKTGKVKHQIIDVHGRVILQQSLNMYSGTNYISISVAKLQHGLHLCRIQNGNQFETSKFMKH